MAASARARTASLQGKRCISRLVPVTKSTVLRRREKRSRKVMGRRLPVGDFRSGDKGRLRLGPSRETLPGHGLEVLDRLLQPLTERNAWLPPENPPGARNVRPANLWV